MKPFGSNQNVVPLDFHHAHHTGSDAGVSVRLLMAIFIWITLGTPSLAVAFISDFSTDQFKESIEVLASLGDRSTGTAGCRNAAEYVKERLVQIGVTQVASHQFSVPVLRNRGSLMYLPDQRLGRPIAPIHANAVSPSAVSPQGIAAPLVYAGFGDLAELNGKQISGSIILMEIDSGKNWLHAASLGAKALIYIDRGHTNKPFFDDKMELTPIHFPRFWMPSVKAYEVFGRFEHAKNGNVLPFVRLTSDMAWEEVTTENIYGLISGSNPDLRDECLVVEAFYDSTALVSGMAPGADEACGIATLIELGRHLKNNPPDRSVFLVATGGHAQSLAGMREMIWSLRSRSNELRSMEKNLRQIVGQRAELLNTLDSLSENGRSLSLFDAPLQSALIDRIKSETDRISTELRRLRLQEQTQATQDVIQNLAQKRLILRRLSWRTGGENLTSSEETELRRLIPAAKAEHHVVINDARRQLTLLKTARVFRTAVKDLSLVSVISLHLSSHGEGFGAFHQGWMYSLKPGINRVPVYTRLDEALRQGASVVENSLGISSVFMDTLRPNRRITPQSYLVDQPALGGEVSALAGYLGVSMATVYDARARWGTPYDLPEYINWNYAVTQGRVVVGLIEHLSREPRLYDDNLPRIGFSTLSGRAKFLRHGELFPDQPAPGSVILAYQGMQRYYTMVDAMGEFHLKGLADSKHVWDKVILEGYRFDPVDGSVLWAIDKEQTGKAAYRVKMQRLNMKTDLVMFSCRETTLFNLLEPRNFRHMIKIQLIDARLEAQPMRYWWSRIDTRVSNLLSIYLEPHTRLKLTLSDTVLKKKMLLINASPQNPVGTGYRIDDWPAIYHTEYRVAQDMWTLLRPRIENLEHHGVYSDRIRLLEQEGTDALDESARALESKKYDRFFEGARKSWALAGQVYNHVEKTQRDVLFGVLFYIALFVPFAFCMERLLFSYSNIYKRIIAFCSILVVLIAVIYHVHPAFKLAYSPMVVILAFFIMGLSLIVTLILFFRFEEEMVLLQRRSNRLMGEEVSRWKAFAAAFFLGVSNLRRRRLRTFLTSFTLVILTFTIMSFTTVKTMRHHTRLLYQQDTPYQGFLFKHANWWNLPAEALGIIANSFLETSAVAPRVWLEDRDRTRSVQIPVILNEKVFEAGGMVGLSDQEADLSDIQKLVIAGRWLNATDRYAVLLPDNMAAALEIDLRDNQKNFVKIWGISFEVVGVFSGEGFHNHVDLDGEPLTPVTFPHEISMEMTDVEMDAIESGEDVLSFQSRYQHVSGEMTLIVPYQTLLAFGGGLKSVAIRENSEKRIQDRARYLVDRFGLTLFSGEHNGTYIYKASDTLSYSGVPHVLIPMLISVFIVLNTMIGSVYERKREIAIYTSVGLAPSHVSFLFIAEALAFGVLSVVIGYLLAQTSARIFSGTALWAGITVNYSSMAGVFAMVLVILVVLVSVIYPSRVAAEIAIPDVKRSWRLPEPKGNFLEITLPFLLKYGERRSVAGYLYDYFDGHQDVSHGLFSTGGLELKGICPFFSNDADRPHECEPTECRYPACLCVHATVWLAPFDFGIMQKVDVLFRQAVNDPGYFEITVLLERESGESDTWRRINKNFLHVLRKQLLIWRSFEDTLKQEYDHRLEEGPAGLSLG